MHTNESEFGPTTKAADPPEEALLQQRVQILLDDSCEKRISGKELSDSLDRLSDNELRRLLELLDPDGELQQIAMDVPPEANQK